jgi:cell division protein FtsL
MNIKSKIRINILLVILVGLFAVFQVILLNKYSTSGEKISSLLIDIKNTQTENSRLSHKIASSSSIAAISVKAERLGLTKNNSLFSLSSPIPVAYNLELSF